MSDTAMLLNAAYRDPERVPWENREPPEELVELVESGHLKPCSVLDVGCGNGHYSVYLARKGFKVTGIDCAMRAIIQASRNAHYGEAKVRFLVRDAHNLNDLGDPFGFVLEWGMLHFMMPEDREIYIRTLAETMSPGALYMALTFNEASPEWGGPGVKYRVSPRTGATVYYSSKEELDALYAPYFDLVKYTLRETTFEHNPLTHLENYYLLRRKETAT